MRNQPPDRLLKRLREWRVAPERDLTLGAPLGEFANEIKRRRRSMGSLGAMWQQLAPPELVERTSLISLSRGVLTVRCDDSACKFEIDRWLRAGGEIELIKHAATRLNRVRLTL